MTLSRAKRKDIAASFIMALWVIAWIVSLLLEEEVPQALNVIMPMAAGSLLGFQLPINKKDGS